MKCNRCHNQDERYFAYDPYHKNWYCRKCIAFGRINEGDPLPIKIYPTKIHHCQYTLQYPLTAQQQEVIRQIRIYQQANKDILVYAACGAGKTEIVMDSIQRYLNEGKKVGFAISRRQVVLEIAERMKQAFPTLQVHAVCEGYTTHVDGDLIVCTMHQLYRYTQAFDLLIMDEIDAFPYRNNSLLETIAQSACKGQRLYLTATPDDTLLAQVKQDQIKMVELFQRPHGYPLIVPQIIHTLPTFQMLYLMYFLHRQRQIKKQTLVFVATIAMAHRCHRLLKWLFRSAVFTSKTKEKEALIDAFHQKRFDLLICTTVLERGITIKGVDIIILHADHTVFNEASLIQIVGRVGRKMEQPTGKGVFLCTRITNDINRCVRAIIMMNQTLHTDSQNE